MVPGTVQTSLAARQRAAGAPLQLDQAVAALLRNARQACPAGPLKVRTWDEGAEVVVEVQDAGGGIPPAILPRIFEPFFTTRGREAAVGLGLTLAYGAVQRHGGRIDVASNVGRGTTVTVRLPAASPSAAALQTRASG